MNELDQTQFPLAIPLFQEMPFSRAVVFSNLCGPQWGRVFVDRETRPQTAMILSDNIYLAGSASNQVFNEELFQFVHASVYPMQMIPDWQCYYNELSERMAQKMGFVKTGVKPVPYVHVPDHYRQTSPEP